MFTAEKTNDEISINSINIVKKDATGKEFSVNLHAESDGTCRLLHILPAILQLDKPSQSKVVIIDDLDNRLHDEMTWTLVEYHLNSLNEKSNSQLIFTTHDIELIDNHILRNDEIWIVRKNQEGVSEMACLVEFHKNKKGITFQKLYKSDSLGGTPRVHLLSSDQLTTKAADMRI